MLDEAASKQTMSSKDHTASTPVKTMEVPLSKAFAMLANEEYHDVSLKGNDGVLVPANRAALSVRSPYFKTMFKKGGFQEATNDVVSIGFSGTVLKSIVEYIHTDTATILATNITKPSLEVTPGAMEEFQTLLSLTEASVYVGLPGLCKKAQKSLAIYMHANPSMAFAILAASKLQGPVISEEMIKYAWKKFAWMTGSLNKIVLGHIPATALGAIFQDAHSKIDSPKSFNLCHLWSQSEPSLPGETKDDRINAAKTLVHDYVELEFMDPDDLETLVVSSGLVSDNQLASALLKQAKKAKHEHSISFHKQSSLAVEMLEWKNVKSKILANGTPDWKTDLLDGPLLMLGRTYQWTAYINLTHASPFHGSWLGVTKSTHNLDPTKWLGDQKNCWGFSGSTGHKYEDGAKGELLVKLGQRKARQITLILDLSDGNTENGTLAVSVKGRGTFIAASNMRAHLVGTSVGYVPAVSCKFATVKILEFKLL
ncbi:expressed unknown protein [Seminavis robusta]|uniref:BTB domain-containing protein n=1 Tax=Seminavis robusta TaxID=568900 RepID=A0A9N8DBV4_9STRA|nr:expressed unknown protein [Seminavis robusta]|eukprot:Sro81_g043521.1  (483) ;mRNA; f:75279-76727